MSKTAGPASKNPWEKPELRQIDLTEEEVEQLRASDDPMGLLLKLKPELGRKGGPAS